MNYDRDSFLAGLAVGLATKGSTLHSKEPPVNYLTFSSQSEFTLSTAKSTKKWNGTLEYSTNGITWIEWDGTTVLLSANGMLMLRGIGNKRIAYINPGYGFVLTGQDDIRCDGNIETLLDYQTVRRGAHPEMWTYAFRELFADCTNLVSAPELPATTLTKYCYYGMFSGCIGLKAAPNLPAITLTEYCYCVMFDGCTSLEVPPMMGASRMGDHCCVSMFRGCSSLKYAAEFPAIVELAPYCLAWMYAGCTALETARVFTLGNYYTDIAPEGCFQYMFQNCSSLGTAFTLPFKHLGPYCYASMFYGCSSKRYAPELPATDIADYCYYRMFRGCTNLKNLPYLPAKTLKPHCYEEMLYNTGTRLSQDPYSSIYQWEFRIPYSGIGTDATDATKKMISLSSQYSGQTPSINTVYYANKPTIEP